MKKYLLLLLLIAFCSTNEVRAQIKGTNITVTVTPSHKDWTYKVGEKIDYTVCVLKSGTLLEDADIYYEMGPEMYPDVKKEMSLKTGTTKITSKMQKPGFHKLYVKAKVNGREYEAWCSVAV